MLNTVPSVLRRRYNLTKKYSSEVEKCVSRFKTYRFYFLVMGTNLVEEVRETFIRINSQGMTVGRADALFAKTTKIGLRDLVATTRRSLINNGCNNIRPEAFVYTLALSSGETRIGKSALEAFQKKFEKKNIGKKEFQKKWKKFHSAFTLASDFLLQEFRITEYNLLPSENIFTMLSLFLYLNQKRATPSQKKELVKWFWHTTLTERYSGAGFNKNIPADLIFLKKLVKNTTAKYQIAEKINPLDFLKKDYKSINKSTSVVGFYLFLKLKKPRYLETGEQMLLEGASSLANRKDRHHIFPQNLLRSKRIHSKWIHSLVNICLLAANENQSINDQHPARYLQDYRRKRKFKTIMKSHLIPYDGKSGIWLHNVKQGFLAFLNQRSILILKNIEHTAGFYRWKMFDKLDEIKRI